MMRHRPDATRRLRVNRHGVGAMLQQSGSRSVTRRPAACRACRESAPRSRDRRCCWSLGSWPPCSSARSSWAASRGRSACVVTVSARRTSARSRQRGRCASVPARLRAAGHARAPEPRPPRARGVPRDRSPDRDRHRPSQRRRRRRRHVSRRCARAASRAGRRARPDRARPRRVGLRRRHGRSRARATGRRRRARRPGRRRVRGPARLPAGKADATRRGARVRPDGGGGRGRWRQSHRRQRLSLQRRAGEAVRRAPGPEVGRAARSIAAPPRHRA